MSKYDSLDARSQLEQRVAEDTERAFKKRGFEVRHNGTATTHAPAGKPDIEVFDNQVHINVEVTKSTLSGQDREWQSIKDHFEETKRNNESKRCFLVFVSPQTHYRTINSMMDWNFAHKSLSDQKFMPLCFSALDVVLTRLTQTPKEQYTKVKLLALFDDFVQFVDDENVLRQVFERLFPEDTELKKDVEKAEDERHQRVVQELIGGFQQLEQKLRDERIALAGDAIKNVIYLVFMKLYEEKKEKDEDQRNRFTLKSFEEYQQNVRDSTKAVHRLFQSIKTDPGLKNCRLLTNDDLLSPRLKDEFVKEHFIKPFEKYTFYTTKIDGLGAAYELLGRLSGKDVTVGQFFTPEAVVKFMIKMANLSPDDIVYDPACGTARFLTNAMTVMEDKCKGSRNEKETVQRIQEKQLYGTDDDPTVAKLAKMNMYIHGDGKSNIIDEDGLTQFKFDDKIDVILTNPPLGDLNYWRSIYDDKFRLNRMEVIPRKDLAEERIREYERRLQKFTEKAVEAQKLGRDTSQYDEKVSLYTSKIAECRILINRGEGERKTTGKQMKGGALFLNAARHYLKNVRDSSASPEWKGGKLLIILDEGVLNTNEYRDVRNFIRRGFYIKAIISLTNETFIPVSHTATKTSILFAVKKEDLDALQQEPIFFAHADRVGVNTRGKICQNHLSNGGEDIFSKFEEFRMRVLNSYENGVFSKRKFGEFKGGEISD